MLTRVIEWFFAPQLFTPRDTAAFALHDRLLTARDNLRLTEDPAVRAASLLVLTEEYPPSLHRMAEQSKESLGITPRKFSVQTSTHREMTGATA